MRHLRNTILSSNEASLLEEEFIYESGAYLYQETSISWQLRGQAHALPGRILARIIMSSTRLISVPGPDSLGGRRKLQDAMSKAWVPGLQVPQFSGQRDSPSCGRWGLDLGCTPGHRDPHWLTLGVPRLFWGFPEPKNAWSQTIQESHLALQAHQISLKESAVLQKESPESAPVGGPVGLAVGAVAAVLEGGALPRDGRAVVRRLVHPRLVDRLCGTTFFFGKSKHQTVPHVLHLYVEPREGPNRSLCYTAWTPKDLPLGLSTFI